MIRIRVAHRGRGTKKWKKLLWVVTFVGMMMRRLVVSFLSSSLIPMMFRLLFLRLFSHIINFRKDLPLNRFTDNFKIRRILYIVRSLTLSSLVSSATRRIYTYFRLYKCDYIDSGLPKQPTKRKKNEEKNIQNELIVCLTVCIIRNKLSSN